MSNIPIKLKADGKYVLIDPGEHKLNAGDEVLVESKAGTELAYIISEQLMREERQENADDKGEFIFIRRLSEKDLERVARLSQEAKSYMVECQAKIEKYRLPMELLDSELSFDEKKLTFYFTAPSRVDFRMLVSDLAHTFKKIIRLQQVGARDEARYLGGVGRCGQGLCCKRFLKGNLESVTLDMAADQNLAQMGSNRVTGVCGKLICCLKYELEVYREAKKKMPPIGDKIKTKEGSGIVIQHNVPKNSYLIRLEENNNIVEVPCSKSA